MEEQDSTGALAVVRGCELCWEVVQILGSGRVWEIPLIKVGVGFLASSGGREEEETGKEVLQEED